MLPIYVVDAFAQKPFTGNPAGVVPLDRPLGDSLMAQIAMEMNHAETAFVVPDGDRFNLRWFTPTIEVDLCGHATLATAHVLWETGRLDPNVEAVFSTRSGLLRARRMGDSIRMDFPAEPADEVASPSQIRAMFGSSLAWVGRNRMDWFVEVDNPCAVLEFEPDFATIASLGYRGLIVTCRAEGEYDFLSRFFAPQSGVPEDPVTGSAHCCLGPYWAAKLGKRQLVGYQASARSGVVGVEIDGNRVFLSGHAVTTLRGDLQLDADCLRCPANP